MAGITSYEASFKGRTINGVRYELFQFIGDKEEADNLTRMLISNGIKAKTIKQGGKYQIEYNVYVPTSQKASALSLL